MPLTSRKLNHIAANYRKMFAGRQQQVILTLRTPAGGATTLTVNAVWRVMEDADPTLSEIVATTEVQGTNPDVIAEFLEADVSLSQMRSCIYAQLGAGAVGAQPAQKYIVTHIDVRGMAPGGARLVTHWMRQH